MPWDSAILMDAICDTKCPIPSNILQQPEHTWAEWYDDACAPAVLALLRWRNRNQWRPPTYAEDVDIGCEWDEGEPRAYFALRLSRDESLTLDAIREGTE